MHRSKAACNQDKITHEYWRVVRMTNFFCQKSCHAMSAFWSIDPKSSLMN